MKSMVSADKQTTLGSLYPAKRVKGCEEENSVVYSLKISENKPFIMT